MGADENIVEAVKPIRSEIAAECREGVPMPFNDVSCISTVIEEGQRYWLMDRIINAPGFRIEEPKRLETIEREGWTVKQRLFLMRYTEHNRMVFGKAAMPLMWDVWFCGMKGDLYLVGSHIDPVLQQVTEAMFRSSSRTFFDLIIHETSAVLEQLAAISHPQNYVVRVTPGLTPRERHHVEKGQPRPDRKTPHYIVVDHDVLVGMSSGHYGTHASPVPHERRGHWRRLAERCRHARTSGKDKVFVRPTYVGERTFADDKNRYEVLMDFGTKEAS